MSMLENIRQASQTWLAKLILAVITVPFALWGIESYVRPTAGQDTIATVGKEKVTSAEFNDALRGQLEQFKRQFGGNIDASIMDTPDMRKSILDNLVDQKLFAEAAKTSGVKISDAALRDRISTESAFLDQGKFVSSRYETFLKAQGYTAQSFEAMLRRDMERQQFAASVGNTGFVPKASIVGYLKAAEQSREIAMVNITPDQFIAKVKVTPEQAKTYYDEHKTEFTIPDQARAEYVELSVDALAPSQQVSAEEIKGYYDSNATRYVQKEERKASHILINAAKDAKEADKKAAKEKADALYAQLKKSPKSFAELAKVNSQDTGSATKGGDLGFFARGLMVKPFEEAAFNAKKDELLAPVLSDFGYHIILVTDIKPEKGKSVADVTPEIEGELKKQKAQKKFAEIAEKFTNAAYEQSASLKAAAEVAGLPVRQGLWIIKGQGGLPPFNNPKLTQALFSDEVLKNKRNTEAIEVSTNNLVAARVLESKPSTVKPLTEVEKSITDKFTREQAGKLAKADGEAKLALLREGKDVDLKWPTLLAVSRNNPGGLPPPVIESAMKLDVKKLPAFGGAENPGGGYSLIQVAKVIDAPVADEAKLKSAKTRVAQAMAQQELLSILAVTRTKTDVTIAKDALEKKDK